MERNVVGEEKVVRIEVERVLEGPRARLPAVSVPPVDDRRRIGIDDRLRPRPMGGEQPLEVIRKAPIVVVEKCDEIFGRRVDSQVCGFRAPAALRKLLERDRERVPEGFDDRRNGCSPVVDDDHAGRAGGLGAKALQGVGEKRRPVAGPHHHGDGSRTAAAVLHDRRADRAPELLERAAGDLRPAEHAERLDRAGARQGQPAVRVQASERARVVAHRLLRSIGVERRVLSIRDVRDVHERVREKGLRDFVEAQPQKPIPIVIRVLRARRADRAIQRFGERAVVRVDLGGRGTEHEIRLELRQLLLDRARERVRARIQGPVREPGEDRGSSPEGRGGEPCLLPPATAISGVVARSDRLASGKTNDEVIITRAVRAAWYAIPQQGLCVQMCVLLERILDARLPSAAFALRFGALHVVPEDAPPTCSLMVHIDPLATYRGSLSERHLRSYLDEQEFLSPY